MKKEINMIEGRIFPQMMRFSLPIMLSSALQTLYNAADSVIVGRSDAANALGAVGSAGPIINIILNLFMGLSVGANVIIARYRGAGDEESVKRTTDTAFVVALVSGILTAILGIAIAKPLAQLVKIDPDIIDMTVLYMQIYFAGLPFIAIYNFMSSTLRGIGNTQGPMLCLIVSGAINVIFNIIFVMFCGMDVDGVALATVISQLIAAVMIVVMVKRSTIGLSLKNIHFDRKIFKNTVRIGVPAGIQGMVFAISNTIIISSINSFGPEAASANTIAGQVDSILYVIINSVTQAVITFTSQNIGARKPERINAVLKNGLLIAVVSGTLLAAISYVAKDFIIECFAPGNDVVKEFAVIKFQYVVLPYFAVALMEIPTGMLRGMNATFIAMVMTVLGICGLRILWLLFIFPMFGTLQSLYVSYPISWIGTAVVNFIAYIHLKKKLDRDILMGKDFMA